MSAIARPSLSQAEWHDLEMEMFVCLDPAAWQDREYDNHSTLLDAINPKSLDAEQWIDVAGSLDAKLVLLVAKHTGGFCWWQTNTSGYGVKETPWRGGKGDLVADVAAACRRHGLRLGIYLSPQDSCFNAGLAGRCPTTREQERYNPVFRQQLTELLSLYGDMAEVWLDGSLVIDVADILRRYAPDAMVFQGPQATIRWVGNEAGHAPYPAWNSVRARDARTGVATAAHGTPDGEVWLPLEADTTIRAHYWFWKRNTEHTLKSLDQLMNIYYRSVGHGAVLLLNSQPDPSGLIPAPDAKRAAEFGAEIRRRFGRSVAETSGQSNSIPLPFAAPEAVDHVVSMEHIAQGERIREYAIEGNENGVWVELVRGTAVGHKKIDVFAPRILAALRFRTLRSAAPPCLRRLAAYHTGLTLNIECGAEMYDPLQAGQWAAQAGTAWTTLNLDITRICDEARQYEIELVPATGAAPLDVRSFCLVQQGMEAPGFLTATDDPLLWKLNVTACFTERSLRMIFRSHGKGESAGSILIRKQ